MSQSGSPTAPLLACSRRQPQYSVARLYVQGTAMALAGLLEVAAAVHAHHPFGACAGAAAALAGLVLLGYGACSAEAAAANPGPAPRLPHQQGRGAPALPRAAVVSFNTVGAFVALLLLVRAASPDPGPPAAAAFPVACAKPAGCARAAEQRPHRAGQQEPVRLRTTLGGAREAVAAWVMRQPRAEVLYQGPEAGGGEGPSGAVVVHARMLSFLWGFADDFWVHLSCAKDGRVLAEAQGQLRLGYGDLGVNPRRVADFLGAMRAAAAGRALPPGECSDD